MESMAATHRLNYIGSKFQLLEWMDSAILSATGWGEYTGKRIADLFAGTGIVSYNFRCRGATVHSNDAELYSAIICEAMTVGVYTPKCLALIGLLNAEIAAGKHAGVAGYITCNYCPLAPCERMFFTVENGRRIDYIRQRLESESLDANDAVCMKAALLLAADAVSNVPAVYGCYLKAFKKKAEAALVLKPVHSCSTPAAPGAKTTHSDVLGLAVEPMDLVYLDPPYNARQYSKNYFPLTMIALPPSATAVAEPLKGKTGIPVDCFVSPFCSKAGVDAAFRGLVGGLTAKWIVLSYNSESLVSKERMLEILGEKGTVSVIERDYKRFKSFEYNEDVAIKEYLFIVKCG
jgi:adenine-specific DNA-methyltransferase